MFQHNGEGGSVVECLTRDREAAGSSLTGVHCAVSLGNNINPSLELVQPECLTRDRGAAGSSLTGVHCAVSLSKNINPSLELVQPRKTRPFITERLLMGRKESNQTNKPADY